MSEPIGVGIYLRALSPRTDGGPKLAARKARDHGLRFAVLLACWQDTSGHRARNRSRLPAYAEAFAHAGVTPFVWDYPHAGLEPASSTA